MSKSDEMLLVRAELSVTQRMLDKLRERMERIDGKQRKPEPPQPSQILTDNVVHVAFQ
jgi:hypothetical protein